MEGVVIELSGPMFLTSGSRAPSVSLFAPGDFPLSLFTNQSCTKQPWPKGVTSEQQIGTVQYFALLTIVTGNSNKQEQ